MDAERRQHVRVGADLPMRLYTPDQAPLDDGPTLVDLSLGGLCFHTAARLATGSAVRFQMTLPDGGEIKGPAVVRWTRVHPTGLATTCGAEFDELLTEDAGRLQSLLEPSRTALDGRALDLALGLGCLGLALLVYREAARDPAALAGLAAWAAAAASRWVEILAVLVSLWGLALLARD